jgi:PEP-CTERM motif
MSRRIRSTLVFSLLSAAAVFGSTAQTLGADFAPHYTVADLGSIADLPPLYGGLAFVNPGLIVIGGNANVAAGLLYEVPVLREAGTNRITGFGSATPFRGGTIGTFNDGGVVFGPEGVLFTSRWPVNQLGQTKPGSTAEDKVIDLAPLGVADSHAALNFVPLGFGGAGLVKLVSWSGGEWYSASLVPDGSGTFDLAGLSKIELDSANGNLAGGPEGFVYVAGANPGFAGQNSMLLSEFSAGTVGAFQLDGFGNPIASSRRDFLTGLTGAEGAVLDPLTGDFLFSTFGGGDRVVRISGFTEPPPPPIPEPGSWAMLLGGGAAVLAWARRRRNEG